MTATCSLMAGCKSSDTVLLCRNESLKRVLGNKKLLLVLDLDHTLLNSTRLDEACSSCDKPSTHFMQNHTL